jgi:hypothetical protein
MATTRMITDSVAFVVRDTSRTCSHGARSMTTSVPIDITANSTSAMIAKITPGLASRVERKRPSKATPVRMTPTVARAAPRAWTGSSVSLRRTTARTTVSPPYAATTPLTTAIGPMRSPVK